MKQSLSELQTQVEAKSKVFGKFSPYPISCDDLLWLIKQVNAAQQNGSGLAPSVAAQSSRELPRIVHSVCMRLQAANASRWADASAERYQNGCLR